jgi:hypothetical protein
VAPGGLSSRCLTPLEAIVRGGKLTTSFAGATVQASLTVGEVERMLQALKYATCLKAILTLVRERFRRTYRGRGGGCSGGESRYALTWGFGAT